MHRNLSKVVGIIYIGDRQHIRKPAAENRVPSQGRDFLKDALHGYKVRAEGRLVANGQVGASALTCSQSDVTQRATGEQKRFALEDGWT